MKNHKQLLADFYLALLSIPPNDRFRILNQRLYAEVCSTLSKELHEDEESIQRIFEKMALEDKR
jgi:hypothetical protein